MKNLILSSFVACSLLGHPQEPSSVVLLSCDFEKEDWWQAWGEKNPPTNVSLIEGEAAFGGRGKSLKFRDADTLKIETVWVNVYHGGTTPVPEDLHLYLDNMVISRHPIGLVKGK